MWKKAALCLILLWGGFLTAQEVPSLYQQKKVKPAQDTIFLESTSINRTFFKIIDASGTEIDTALYHINSQKAALVFSPNFTSSDSLTVRYLNFPEHLTKVYRLFDESRVVSNQSRGNLYRLEDRPISTFKPFDGLTTSGSITRGVTVGNNQNSVVNSNLDLQITGKISDKVSLRASIQDANIPLQEGGYSQRLDEFDQIFIELFSDDWAIRAGDLFLENRRSRFMNFNKKVQGLSTRFQWGAPDKQTTVEAAGALVRGQYARSNLIGQEGNQGPYKLRGNNGELFVLVISGSERVFVNGILLQRGENNQYMIDYNAGEITFTSLFPITSEMRISIEYQYAERSFTRFITYGGVEHKRDTWQIAGYLYSESDIKNQPLQQNLSEAQVEVLKAAGDNLDAMVAPSAFEDSFSENKILYRKVFVNGVEVFEFSNDPEETLFNVRFSNVGNNNGNYILANNQAVGRIYAYVEPISGIPQGSFEPVIRLVAPSKIQMATLMGNYQPSEKTMVDFEAALSSSDQNLFSPLDNDDNVGWAGRLNAKQRLWSGSSTLDALFETQIIQRDFRTIERLFNIEFDRDWNLTQPLGNQSLITSGLEWQHPRSGMARYAFEQLRFSENFNGTRHVLEGRIQQKKWMFTQNGSFMQSDGTLQESRFLRSQTQVRYHTGKQWVGATYRMEDVDDFNKTNQERTLLSQRFHEWGAFVGRGDSTKVYVELGYLHRTNDSLQSGRIERVNTSDSYYVKSRLIQTQKSDLSVFVNYRNLNFVEDGRADEPSLNSRILYNDRFWDGLVQWSSAYETTSGTIAQQEFTYLEVEPGLGIYTWIDYNGNGIQELEEFEVAPFPDQARYIRVFLPNQIFIRTHQNRFSQSVTLNPMNWQSAKGIKKLASHFFNQTSFLMERKIRRDANNFDLNPFSGKEDDLLGLNVSFRNSLFYNRGKQQHSMNYTFLNNRVRSLLSVGSQDASNESHQFQYTHLVKKFWLVNLAGKTIQTKTTSENFELRNFEIDGFQVAPKLSYVFSQNASWDVFYEYQEKQNQIGEQELLQQQRIGTSFTWAGEKQFTMSGEFSLYDNTFAGNANGAVAFQMLEGLQPGKNQTWRLLIQKNLTQYLDINVNYLGRKSENLKAIHTGSVQLRAFF